MFGCCQKFERGANILGTFAYSVLGLQVIQQIAQAVRFLEIVLVISWGPKVSRVGLQLSC